MEKRDYQKLIDFENGIYESKEEDISIFKKKFSSLSFYLPLIKIIFKCSKLAKLGIFDEKAFYNHSFEVFKLLEKVGVRFKIEGINNIEEYNAPAVFVGNHMSTLETFILPLLLIPFTPISFVVKKSLVEYPVFGHIMKAVDPITVSRTNPRNDLKTVIEEGSKKISQGRSIVVFPQTTRKIDFVESEFNSIGIKLAKRANVPVIPFALKTDAWQNGRWIKDFGPIDVTKKVYFSFGKPIFIESKGDREHKLVVDFISEKIRQFI